MGWLFKSAIQSKAAMVADIERQIQPPHYELLRSSTVGNNHWYVAKQLSTGETFIGLNLLRSSRDGWGYKDLCESMGPCQVDCPLAFLDLAPVPAGAYGHDWRDRVRAHHASKRARPTPTAGAVVEYGPHRYELLQPAGPHRGWNVARVSDGCRFRMPAYQLASATFVPADTAETLAQRLSEKYPDLNFQVLPRGNVSEDDDEYVPEFVVTWGVDVCNTDPFSSAGDGRFPAHPSDHGIEFDDAMAIRRHNRICMAVGEGEEESANELLIDQAVDAAINAGSKVIQDALGVKTGDFAGTYWSGSSFIGLGETDAIREAFATYLKAQRADAAAHR